MSLLKTLLDGNEREVRKLRSIVETKINSLEPQFEKLSNEELAAKTAEFRERLSKGETLDDLMPEAFAVVREAAKRVLGQRHYDVQMIGGIVLHHGRMAEMATGEGKTPGARAAPTESAFGAAWGAERGLPLDPTIAAALAEVPAG